MSWHVDADLLARYRERRLDPAAAWSVEQHITSCGPCRTELASEGVARDRLDANWDAIVERVDVPRAGVVEAVLRAVGVPDHVARLLTATPSLTVPWLLGVAVVLGAAAFATRQGGDPALFLVLAPLVPVVGVAIAFGRWADPTHEVALAAPVPSSWLLLVRAVAVTASSLFVATIAALLLPALGWGTAAWVVPALAVTSVLLALSTWWDPVPSAVAVSAGWLVLVMPGGLAGEAAFEMVGQVTALMIGSGALIVLLARRANLEQERGW